MSSNLYMCEKCGDIVPHTVIEKIGEKCLHCSDGIYNIDSGLSLDDWYVKYQKLHFGVDSKMITTDMVYRHIRSTLLSGKKSYQPALSERYQNELEASKQQQEKLNKILQGKSKTMSASTPRCPKCGSTNLGKTKRGFSTGRAVAAGMLTGFLDVAAVAGAAGSNKMVNCCNDCGHTWK